MFDSILQTSLFTTCLTLGSLGLLVGALLTVAHKMLQVNSDVTQTHVVEQIDALLPQTQCGQCGFPGCRPYAQAIADGVAINQCPPGGQGTIDALADLLHVPTLPLNPQHGEASTIQQVAFIREEECIGCTKCIQACPVDAILGAAKWMHTVIKDECTGCDLCVEPCPVDCIDMVPVPETLPHWYWPAPEPVSGVIATDRHQSTACQL